MTPSPSPGTLRAAGSITCPGHLMANTSLSQQEAQVGAAVCSYCESQLLHLYWLNNDAMISKSTLSCWLLRCSSSDKLMSCAGGPGDPARGPLQLWIADTATGKARPLLGKRRLNTVFSSYNWIDDDTLVAAVIPDQAGPPPQRPPVPLGPKIQDNSSGKKSQNRTWTDLLKDDHDGDVFEYYGTSELVTLNVRRDPPDSEGTLLAPPRMYTE